MRHALVYGDTPVPSIYSKGLLCRMFHCLPSQLETEGSEILQIARALNIGDQILTEQEKRRHGR